MTDHCCGQKDQQEGPEKDGDSLHLGGFSFKLKKQTKKLTNVYTENKYSNQVRMQKPYIPLRLDERSPPHRQPPCQSPTSASDGSQPQQGLSTDAGGHAAATSSAARCSGPAHRKPG